MESSTDVKIVMKNLSRRVDDLEISDDAKNWLRSADLVYVSDLVQKTEEDLMDLWFFSPMYLKEVKTCLWSIDLELGMKIPKRWQPTSDQLDKQLTLSLPINEIEAEIYLNERNRLRRVWEKIMKDIADIFGLKTDIIR